MDRTQSPNSSTASVADILAALSEVPLLNPQQLREIAGRSTTYADPQALAQELVQRGWLTLYQARQLANGQARTLTLGPYVLLEQLGEGGMGVVFKARHRKLNRITTLKVIRPERLGNEASVKRFQREILAASQLHHANIVHAYDADQVKGAHFLVMEYVEGINLDRLVRQVGPLPAARACEFIRQAARGLQHAHEHGLVHRDIKPANLLLTGHGSVVKIVDFGLARLKQTDCDNHSLITEEGAVMGTPDYLAPEQSLDAHQVDIRADLYSLGCTFYYLLTGRVPFPGGSLGQKLMRHQLREPQLVEELRPEVPAVVLALVRKFMAKRPEDRYQTPAEAIEALTAAMGEAGLTADSASGVARDEQVTLVKSPGEALAETATCAPSTGEGIGLLPASDEKLTPAGAIPADSPQHEPAARASRRGLVLFVGAASLLLAGALGAFLLKGGKTVSGDPSQLVERPSKPQGVAEPRSHRLRLLIPAYFYPGGPDLYSWERLLESAPSAPLTAIVNPNSGPGDKSDPNYVQIMGRGRKAGMTLIGYVRTNYGKRPEAEVTADVDRWFRLYPDIQGIFFDEQASAAEGVPYYLKAAGYVRRMKTDALVVTNPGTVCSEEYLSRSASDMVCLTESRGELDGRLPAWTNRQGPKRLAALFYRVPSADQMRRAIGEIMRQGVGYVYLTDGDQPNPWNRLPSWWAEELAAVRQANQGQAAE